MTIVIILESTVSNNIFFGHDMLDPEAQVAAR